MPDMRGLAGPPSGGAGPGPPGIIAGGGIGVGAEGAAVPGGVAAPEQNSCCDSVHVPPPAAGALPQHHTWPIAWTQPPQSESAEHALGQLVDPPAGPAAPASDGASKPPAPLEPHAATEAVTDALSASAAHQPRRRLARSGLTA